MAESEIYPLDQALELVKEKSRGKYAKEWQVFTTYCKNSFDDRMPFEREMMDYLKYLRHTLNRASSTIVCNYSMLNKICKNRYGKQLQIYARLSDLLKSYNVDTKKKAEVFEKSDIINFVNQAPDEPYWLVRKVIIILAYFGGLRQTELFDLKLERVSVKDGYLLVKHSRCKQRSDKRETAFKVPLDNFGEKVVQYMNCVKNDLNIGEGRFLYTGRGPKFIKSCMGRNMVQLVPRDVAKFLKLADCEKFTFHSLRRTSATVAANEGATGQLLTDYYGWKDLAMANEYISTSDASLNQMAEMLSDVPAKPKIPPPAPKIKEVSADQVPVKELAKKTPFCVSDSPATFVFSQENFDLGEPVISDNHSPPSLNNILPNTTISANKIVIIQHSNIQSFNM